MEKVVHHMFSADIRDFNYIPRGSAILGISVAHYIFRPILGISFTRDELNILEYQLYTIGFQQI